MVRMQIRLTEEQSKTLKAMAGERGISVAALIRECVDHYLRTFRAVTPEERKRRALSAVGRFRSGLRDLGREHDCYLAEEDSG